MTGFLKKLLPHFLVVLGFIVMAVAYFSPILQGKEIYQSDIAQYVGMARQQNEFRAETGEEPYWTDAAFGGMPTYQLGAHYPHNYIKALDSALRFLPRPADYLFLYFIGIYVLLLVLRVNYKLAFLGALAFGFSTYLIIILGVGHNAKAHAIAYMPLVLGGILLCFRGKYLGGFLLLAVGMALEIGANHFQMTYYLLLLVIVLGMVYLLDAFKRDKLPHFFKALGVMVAAVILAVGANATNLMATQEYTAFSTRGDTGLTIKPDGSKAPESGLDYSYITEYSYGKLETFNLFIPRFMGGASMESIGTDSESYKVLLNLGVPPVQAAQFTREAPTYIGATVLFLFVLALFLVKGRTKWWIVGGSILALLLSWGRNFSFLTELFIDVVPLYNKFRAVSSLQVILELCIPILAVVGLSKLFYSDRTREEKYHALKWSAIIVGGLALVFLLFKSVLFSFSGAVDAQMQYLGPEFLKALKEDRKAIFTSDTIRSLIFVLLSAGVVWYFLKEKINRNTAIALLGLLILVDLVAVDRRYVNSDDFVNSRMMEEPFQATPADLQIMEDTTHYRVLDLSANPFNTARTSYFHKSIGGYHAAKPGRIQDLFNFHIAENNLEVLNMLNAKYFIVAGEEGIVAQENPDANGNAWFVENVMLVDSANEEIMALEEINTKKTAVLNRKFEEFLPAKGFKADEKAQIELTAYSPNELTYQYFAEGEQLVVFSEIYYPNGWQAYIDGEKVPHFQADYVLRAMIVPGGEHAITFKFEPKVIQTGSTIALASSILLGLALIGGLYFVFRKKTASEEKE